MFTAFMVALTLTSVANVLVTMAVGPLFTALIARSSSATACRRAPGPRSSSPARHRLDVRGRQARRPAAAGTLVRAVRARGRARSTGPCCSTSVMPRAGRALPRRPGTRGRLPGAPASDPKTCCPRCSSARCCRRWRRCRSPGRSQTNAHDLGLLALLGVIQLALPCLVVVRLTRVLPAPELALLSLLEVLFGVAWAWLGAGERPPSTALAGGALVLGALIATETPALRRARRCRDACRPPGPRLTRSGGPSGKPEAAATPSSNNTYVVVISGNGSRRRSSGRRGPFRASRRDSR